MKGWETVSISRKKAKLRFKYFVNLKNYLISFFSLVGSLHTLFLMGYKSWGHSIDLFSGIVIALDLE